MIKLFKTWKEANDYYDGKIGENIVVHKVELEGVEKEYGNTPKVVAKKITIGKRIL